MQVQCRPLTMEEMDNLLQNPATLRSEYSVREGGKEGRREVGGREGGREGVREGGREGEREEVKEGRREEGREDWMHKHILYTKATRMHPSK